MYTLILAVVHCLTEWALLISADCRTPRWQWTTLSQALIRLSLSLPLLIIDAKTPLLSFHQTATASALAIHCHRLERDERKRTVLYTFFDEVHHRRLICALCDEWADCHCDIDAAKKTTIFCLVWSPLQKWRKWSPLIYSTDRGEKERRAKKEVPARSSSSRDDTLRE